MSTGSDSATDPAVGPRMLLSQLVASTETLAAVGLALAARAGDVVVPDDYRVGVDAVARSVLGDIDRLDPISVRSLGALARSMLAQAAAFSSSPVDPAGWAVEDPMVLQTLGHASAGLVGGICDVLVARYPGLDERLGRPGATILDVGTGVGALAIALARRYSNARVVGLDVWPPSLELAAANVAAAGLTDRVELCHRDVVDLDDVDRFDLVWFAGPFIPATVLDTALSRVAVATKPGGIVVYGTFGGGDVLSAALADLRTLRSGGPVVTDDEIATLLTRAGLGRVETVGTNIGLPARLVAAQR